MLKSAQYAEGAAAVFATGWFVTTIGNFYSYWLRHTDRYKAAIALLKSEVCTNSELRIAVRHFDRCAEAQATTATSPMHQAFFSVAEDVHICGNRRCELLYVDITERLTSILVMLSVILIFCIMKGCRRQSMYAHNMQGDIWQLPRRTIEYDKKRL